MRLKKGFLLVFEGIDGAGKTTQANLLYNALISKGFDVVKSKEPTDSIYGIKIRKLASGERDVDNPQQEYNLFLSDRRIHVKNFIKPSLEENKIVILDRYYFSNIAYQGALGMDPKQIQVENEKFAPIPEFVFLIEVSPRTGLRRIQKFRGETPNLFEQEENLKMVDHVYKSLDETYIQRITGTDKREVIHRQIMNVVESSIDHHIEKHIQCQPFESSSC